MENRNESNQSTLSSIEMHEENYSTTAPSHCGEKPSDIPERHNHSTEEPIECKQEVIDEVIDSAIPKVRTGSRSSEMPCACQYCGKRFDESIILENHLEVHSGEEINQSQQSPDHRDRRLSGQQLHECGVQIYQEEEPTGSSQPITRVNDGNGIWSCVIEDSFQCEHCSMGFPKLTYLKYHILKKHSCEKQCACEQCDRSYCNTSNLKDHMHAHPKEEQTKDKQTATRHNENCNSTRYSQTLAVKTSFQCGFCRTDFPNMKVLKIHLRSHLEKKPYVCEQCNKSYSRLDSERHMEFHSDTKPFECEKCKQRFYSREHLRRHTQFEDKPAKSQLQRKRLKKKIGCKSYLLTRGVAKSFRCEQCNRSCSTKQQLKRHSQCHSGGKRNKAYACDQCGMSLSSASCLKRHIKCHSGEEPYKCSHCDKSFFRIDYLKRHTECMHSGEKPYKCLHCEKSFSIVDYLKRHTVCHSGEKPYKCEQCNESFPRVEDLKLHTGCDKFCHKDKEMQNNHLSADTLIQSDSDSNLVGLVEEVEKDCKPTFRLITGQNEDFEFEGLHAVIEPEASSNSHTLVVSNEQAAVAVTSRKSYRRLDVISGPVTGFSDATVMT